MARWCLLLLCLLTGMQVAAAAVPRQLRVCGDINETAPYTYFARDGNAASGAVTGYNVALLDSLLATSGRSASYTLLPWKRCLALAAAGQFDIVLDAVEVDERKRDFYYPRAHYTISPILLFSKANPLPKIRVAADLQPFSLCQVLGWDYSLAGIRQPEALLSRPPTLNAALDMLRAGRCQVMIYDLELLRGLGRTASGATARLDDFDNLPLPWLASVDMHWMVSRAPAYATDLNALLDAGIASMQQSGEARRLLLRVGP